MSVKSGFLANHGHATPEYDIQSSSRKGKEEKDWISCCQPIATGSELGSPSLFMVHAKPYDCGLHNPAMCLERYNTCYLICGPATESLFATSPNFSKFFMNIDASFLACFSYSSFSFHILF
ncbi:hypothetical protein NTE_02446 [Candidatus Nitrososphaera evergladensis SR1]|uniref:Uncharacterized protein n=1 Tax=Candidatus Nitrososphaera evergladensis SR1 TaxID=1459636 RepID=A0A075MSD7_9ARCH|nr:hypothetical protein NTE_02446 [Candidatus Nitrososphaera evergladensis SR1]